MIWWRARENRALEEIREIKHEQRWWRIGGGRLIEVLQVDVDVQVAYGDLIRMVFGM